MEITETTSAELDDEALSTTGIGSRSESPKQPEEIHCISLIIEKVRV